MKLFVGCDFSFSAFCCLDSQWGMHTNVAHSNENTQQSSIPPHTHTHTQLEFATLQPDGTASQGLCALWRLEVHSTTFRQNMRPIYSVPLGILLCCFCHCKMNLSAMGKMSFPVKDKDVTRAKLSTKIILAPGMYPRAFPRNVAYATGMQVPGPFTRTKSGDL